MERFIDQILGDLRRRIYRIDNPPVVRQVHFYTLWKLDGERRQPVGFRLTEREAHILAHVLVKKIVRLNEESRAPFFEVTLTEIKEEV